MSAPRRAVFLDRDGVLIEDVPYRRTPDGLRLLDGVAAALRRLTDAGFVLAVASNQSGIARGLLTEAALAQIHQRLAVMLEREGVHVAAWLYCPHHPDEGAPPYRRHCECRKPRPGMLLRAAEQLGLELTASYLVGDRRSDVEAGRAAGVTPLRVRTGHAGRDSDAGEDEAEVVVDTLSEAAEWILRHGLPIRSTGT